ncbi:acyltransferase [Cytophagaceae bacterium DM2B3-1]|uniref:Acyltransferase n=1 Tax=Xanthocytophaga flava TaxID=3048013 RepID=A0ABT7CZE4_9BACT|nr:acyltransferase [Xanthocytophaga flavus]MDJ1498335.1 acyltransferase [Xanthocytophaga flavus]
MNYSLKKTYFPGLTGLRFIAAFVVLISHLEEMKKLFGYDNWRDVPGVRYMGATAVNFFFVLSGFLITYLLLQEKSTTGTVSLMDFYSKRMTRIWPLYYFLLLLGLVIIPQISWMDIPHVSTEVSARNVFFFLTIFPNAVFALYGFTPYLVQTWSIGVEEQFYAVWPLLFLRTSKPIRNISIFFVVYLFIYVIASIALPKLPPGNLNSAIMVFKLTRIDSMAVGGLGAWLVFSNKQRILALLLHPLVQIVTGIAILLLMVSAIAFPLSHSVFSVLFLVWILNVALKPESALTKLLEGNVFNYLGKISYGIYMYHFLVIGFVLHLLRGSFLINPLGIVENLVLYVLTTALVILVSALSYHAFELKVMRWQPRVAAGLRKIKAKLSFQKARQLA